MYRASPMSVPRRTDAAKRVIDALGATAGLIVLSPVIAAVAVVVRWRLGAPVLHRQERLGIDDAPFVLVKFRTMTDTRDARGALLPDDERLTPMGSFLRSTSLDELPELLHVLRGTMSLVGPRPLPVAYRERFTRVEARRSEVRPGLTGWAQVNGRNSTSWEERLALDVWYVDHRSLTVDLKILLRTVAVVIGRRGVAAEGHATMSEFRPPCAGVDAVPASSTGDNAPR